VTGPIGFRKAINPFYNSIKERYHKMNKIFVSSFLQAEALRERAYKEIDMYRAQRSLIKRRITVIDDYLSVLKLPTYYRPLRLMKLNIRRQNMILTYLIYVQVLRSGFSRKNMDTS